MALDDGDVAPMAAEIIEEGEQIDPRHWFCLPSSLRPMVRRGLRGGSAMLILAAPTF